MLTGPSYQLILQAMGIVWIFIHLALIGAAWLLFLSDRRAHTLCLLSGYVVMILASFASHLIPFWTARSGTPDDDPLKYYVLVQGFSLIGGGLVAYGLFSFALIFYRKCRQPVFDE